MYSMRDIRKIGLSGFAVIFFVFGLCAQSAHGALRKGEVSYDRGDYAAAETAYQKAGNTIGGYNAGNAAFQQNNLSSAANYYRDAANKSTDAGVKADALYNLGNALLLQKKYAEAITAYESSLRFAPNQWDAKKNLQVAKQQALPPPPPNPPPPPPPPPPSPKPQRYYVDQAQQTRVKEIPPSNIPPEQARQMLAKAVLPEEQKNAKAYRELSPANRPSRLKKDW